MFILDILGEICITSVHGISSAFLASWVVSRGNLEALTIYTCTRMFWDSKVCCFIWKRGVGHSILVGGPVNEVKHNFVIFVVTSFSFFS